MNQVLSNNFISVTGHLKDYEAILFMHDIDLNISNYVTGEIFSKITGFTGSRAMCIVSHRVNCIISDGRYKIQMENEVPKHWFTYVENTTYPYNAFAKLQETGVTDIFIVKEFVSIANLASMTTFAIDYNITVHTISIKNILSQYKELQYVGYKKYFTHFALPPYAYQENVKIRQDKTAIILRKLCAKADCVLITSKSFNSWLFLERKITKGFDMNVGYDVIFYPESGIFVKLLADDEISQYCRNKNTIALDPKYTNAAISEEICKLECSVLHCNLTQCYSISNVKDAIEIENIKKIHIEDGIAIIRFLFKLHHNIKQNIPQVECFNEKSASDLLLEERKKSHNFICNSFQTISAFGKNGAIVHYSNPNVQTALRPDGFYLLDSGGHYYYGTTDITRIIYIGSASEEEKRHFTIVLKAHIELATSVFNTNTPSSSLDFIARRTLLCNGLDYNHSTGHGVGYLGNVHEGPVAISTNIHMPLEQGMIVSNEPGLYIEDAYGIRIENILQVVNVENSDANLVGLVNDMSSQKQELNNLNNKDSAIDTKAKNERNTSSSRALLGFRTISMVYIDTSLILTHLLEDYHIKWINIYHEQVRNNIMNHLDQEEQEFLFKATESISKI